MRYMQLMHCVLGSILQCAESGDTSWVQDGHLGSRKSLSIAVDSLVILKQFLSSIKNGLYGLSCVSVYFFNFVTRAVIL